MSPRWTRPLAAVIVSTSGSAAAMEQVRTILDTAGSRWDPLAVTSADIDSQNRQRLTRLEQLANAALLMTLVIAGCSLTVAVSGGLIERKRPFALLRLTGVRMTDLTRVVLAEGAIPLLAMTALSVALGLAVAAALLLAAAKGSVIIAWQLPGAGYWGALAAGIVLALLMVAATLPLLRRLTTLETARFE